MLLLHVLWQLFQSVYRGYNIFYLIFLVNIFSLFWFPQGFRADKFQFKNCLGLIRGKTIRKFSILLINRVRWALIWFDLSATRERSLLTLSLSSLLTLTLLTLTLTQEGSFLFCVESFLTSFFACLGCRHVRAGRWRSFAQCWLKAASSA